MDWHTEKIRADGGSWREVEVLGNRALVKVRASPATIAEIAADPHCRRIPVALIDRPLSDMTAGQRNAIRDELTAMGFPLQEIRERLWNDLSAVTMRQVFRFMASRRVKPRWDGASLVFDGPVRPCESVDDLDGQLGD